MGRVLLGLIKGLLVGGGIGYCLLKLHNPSGLLVYLSCGLVGAVVGLLCGRAPWRAETIWTPVLKAIFGLLVGAGLYAVGHRFVPGSVHVQGFADTIPFGSGAVLAPAIGMLYGLFVEVDDGGAAQQNASARSAQKSLPKSSAVDVED